MEGRPWEHKHCTHASLVFLTWDCLLWAFLDCWEGRNRKIKQLSERVVKGASTKINIWFVDERGKGNKRKPSNSFNSQISLVIIEAKWKMSFEVCPASSSFIANDLGEPGFARYIFKNPLQNPSHFYLSPMKFPCTRSPLSCRNLCTSWVQWDSESHNNWIIYH